MFSNMSKEIILMITIMKQQPNGLGFSVAYWLASRFFWSRVFGFESQL